MLSTRNKMLITRATGKLERIAKQFINPTKTIKHKLRIRNQKIKAYKEIQSYDPDLTKNDNCHCLIFSKDRPLQLHSLLSSYKHFIKNSPKLLITYSSSTEDFKNAYQDVFKIHHDIIENIVYRDDHQFRETLIPLMKSVDSKFLFFLVDDNIFTRPFDINELLEYNSMNFVPALRYHENLEWCYNHHAAQPVPPIYKDKSKSDEHFSWIYKEGKYDWCYPLSLDGHIFNRFEILTLIENSDFETPNSLEYTLQKFNESFINRHGVSFKSPVMVNVPCNKVQTENDNPFAQTYHQDELLQKWNEGLQIDFLKLANLTNKSAHQSVSFDFIKRPSHN